MISRRSSYLLGVSLYLWLSPQVSADAAPKIFRLTLENHVFTPSELAIPANEKVKIVIQNNDDTAEEFDSFDLNRERVIFAHRNATIFVGPLPAGKYEFFGEYHPNSARGVVIVEEIEQ